MFHVKHVALNIIKCYHYKVQRIYCNLVRVGRQQPYQSLFVCTFFMVMIMNENIILKKLIKLAQKAARRKEVPISALIIYKNKIISSAYNKREKLHDVTAHAEVIAIKKAAKKLKRWNLSDCSMYVSLKPCSMCNNIIKQSRIKCVYYYLNKPENKKEYDKTEMIYKDNEKFISNYQQILITFFKNKR